MEHTKIIFYLFVKITGIQFFLINISYIVGTPVAAFVFLPVFYRLQVRFPSEDEKIFFFEEKNRNQCQCILKCFN